MSHNKWSGTGKLLELRLSYLSVQLGGKQARQYGSREWRRDNIEEITLSLYSKLKDLHELSLAVMAEGHCSPRHSIE